MTRGSNAAIPAGDDAWDARADAAFLQALPVILAEVFAEHRSEGLTGDCAGGEELVLDVTLTLQAFDPRFLAGRIFADQPSGAVGEDATIALLDLRPDRVEVRIPLMYADVRLAELVAVPRGRPLDRRPASWPAAALRRPGGAAALRPAGGGGASAGRSHRSADRAGTGRARVRAGAAVRRWHPPVPVAAGCRRSQGCQRRARLRAGRPPDQRAGAVDR